MPVLQGDPGEHGPQVVLCEVRVIVEGTAWQTQRVPGSMSPPPPPPQQQLVRLPIKAGLAHGFEVATQLPPITTNRPSILATKTFVLSGIVVPTVPSPMKLSTSWRA